MAESTRSRQMSDIRGEPEKVKAITKAPRPSMGSRCSSALSSASTSATTWTPRIIHSRWWAPHGAPEEKQLNRAADLDLQKQVDAIMSEAFCSKHRWLAPCTRNHPVNSWALHAHNNTTKLLCEQLRDAIIKANLKVGNVEIKVAAETSPARRRSSASTRRSAPAGASERWKFGMAQRL